MSYWQQFMDHDAFMFITGHRATPYFQEAYEALERGENVTIFFFNREMRSFPETQEEFESAFVDSYDLSLGGEVECEEDVPECQEESRKMFRIRTDSGYMYYVGFPEPEFED